MSDYTTVALGDVSTITSSKRIFLSDYVEDGVPFYRSKEIIEKSLGQQISTELFISREKFSEIKNKYGFPTSGDILIAAVGERAGIPYLVNNDGEFYFKDGNLIWLKDFSSHVSAKYLYRYLKSYVGQQQLESTMIGSAQKALTIVGLKYLSVPLPPLPEQESIAEVLSSLDDKIDLLHRNNKTLEQLAETLFRQWFVENSELENWQVSIIGNYITTQGGGTPSTTNPQYWDGNIAWTSPRDLSGSQTIFMRKTSRTLTEAGLSKISSILLPIQTVLLSSRAPIGYLSITDIPLAINQGYIACVCDRGISPWYMYNWLKCNMDVIVNAANGSTFLEISKTVFRGLEFIVPPQQLLEKFDSVCQSLFSKIKENEKQITHLETLRDTLLPKLMSGSLRIK